MQNLQEVIDHWKLNKGLLASKIEMPLGTFCNKLNIRHSAFFSDVETVRLKMVLREICGDIEDVTTIDFNDALKVIIKK